MNRALTIVAGAYDARPLVITYQSLRSLVPYARNSRTHSRPQIQKLKGSLREYGWTTAMAVADGGMLAGHGRLMAALELADEGVAIPGNPDPWQGPTVDLSHLTETQRRAYVIADNKLALDAGWDTDMLAMELGDLASDGFDLSLAGFNASEVEILLNGWNPEMGKIDKTPPDNASLLATLKVKCEQEQAGTVEQAIRDMLAERGFTGVEIG